MADQELTYITANELLSMKSRPNVAIIDVRDEERSSDGHIAGSLHFRSFIFSYRLPAVLEAIRGKDTLVFHCVYSKYRGPLCARKLADHLTNVETEVKNIMVLENGYDGWVATGFPVCRCKDNPCKVEDQSEVCKDNPCEVEDQSEVCKDDPFKVEDQSEFWKDNPCMVENQSEVPAEPK